MIVMIVMMITRVTYINLEDTDRIIIIQWDTTVIATKDFDCNKWLLL